MRFIFPRTFFLHSLGVGLLYWAVSRQRNVCCPGQSPGNEMTVLLVNLQATTGGVHKIQAMLFKSGLRFGWRQRAHVACGREIRCAVAGSHPRCCGRMCPRITSLLQRQESGMSKEWGPSRDEGSGWRNGSRLWRALALASWRQTLLLAKYGDGGYITPESNRWDEIQRA